MINRFGRWTVLAIAALTLPALPAVSALGADKEQRGSGAEQGTGAGETTRQPADPRKGEGAEGGAKTEKEPVDDGESDDDNGGPSRMLWLLPVALLLMFVWMGRRPRKGERQRKEMLANLKKGDKITSIGGIVGTVIEVRDNDITVKVDETSNTRMKFARWAVRGTGTPADEKPDDKRSK